MLHGMCGVISLSSQGDLKYEFRQHKKFSLAFRNYSEAHNLLQVNSCEFRVFLESKMELHAKALTLVASISGLMKAN